MGIRDHAKTWHFGVRASPEACIGGFVAAFEGRGRRGFLAKGNWNIDRDSRRAVATYAGRGGLTGALTNMSQGGMAQEARATGSGVTFETEANGDGRTVCVMWLSSANRHAGFIDDASIFRQHMQGVEDELRKLDPGLSVSKS